jgi:hypothetical protein
MKHLILILIVLCSLKAYSQDTVKEISFYPEYKAIYNNHIKAVSFTAAGIGITMMPQFLRNNISHHQYKNMSTAFYIAGGLFGIIAIGFELANINEYGKIARKHKKLKFTSNGMILKF